MGLTMKAAVMHAPREIRMEERPRPSAAPGELLVKVRHVGICGSDMHFLKDGRLGNWVVDAPLILGHESAGEVVELGAGVRGFAVGDAVALEPGVPYRRRPDGKIIVFRNDLHATPKENRSRSPRLCLS